MQPSNAREAGQAETGQEATSSLANIHPEETLPSTLQNAPPRNAPPAQLYQFSTAPQDVDLGPRPSRASSIVSTRTGVTIATLQDDARSARSIDVVLGARVFHINRDGSRVLEQASLPPYSPPPPGYSNPITIPETDDDGALSDPETPTQPPESPTGHDAFPVENQSLNGESSGNPVAGERGLTGDDDLKLKSNHSLHQGGLETSSNTISRNPSFTPGPERISVVQKRRSVSQSEIPRHTDTRTSTRDWLGLRRRNGIKPPKIFTAFSTNRIPTGENHVSPTSRLTRSAGPSLGGDDNSASKSSSPTNHDWTGNPNRTDDRKPLATLQGHPTFEEGHVETDIPPSMESENDISIHYTRLIRSIDREHRKALHQRDRELASMRERLNEVDQVYRKELKARDFTIEELRQGLARLEADIEGRIEKAQNAVEDVWEARWKDRDRGLTERMGKMKVNFQRDIDRAITSRDAEWAAAVAKGEAPEDKGAESGE